MASRKRLYLWLVVVCNDISYNSIFLLKVKEYQWKTNTGHGNVIFDAEAGVNIFGSDCVAGGEQYQ